MGLGSFDALFRRRRDPTGRGNAAEAEAARWLATIGYRVIARNLRTPLGELDLIAYEGAVLCLIEVKARRSSRFGSAADAVGSRKRKQVVRVARWVLAHHRHRGPVRIDVVALDYTPATRGAHAGWRCTLYRGAIEAPSA